MLFRYHSTPFAEGLRSGALLDVSETARLAGFCVPVALTQAAWKQCVAPANGIDAQADQLVQVLLALLSHTNRVPVNGYDRVEFQWACRVNSEDCTPPVMTLKAYFGFDSESHFYVTISLPHEY